MKRTKKLFSLALALVMTLAMAVPAFADEETAGTNDSTNAAYQQGTITVQNAVVGETYDIYCLLDLESYNNTNKAFAYTVNADWATFFAQESIVYDATVNDDTGYVVIDDQGYVTWAEGANAADFAALAIAYAKAKNVAAVESVTATATPVVFDELELGYYLIDSSMGTLCALDTTNNEVIVYEKNGAPTSDKKVLEDFTNTYGANNTADIIDTIYYQATITVPGGVTTGDTDDSFKPTTTPGAQNYVLHDTMAAELEFGSVTGITLNSNVVDTTNYTVKTTELTDDCTFEVVFTQDFCATLNKDDVIVVSYTATFNDEATIVADTEYKNSAWLTYGEAGGTQTPAVETKTKTFDVEVFKYAMIDDTETALEGAIFYLYKMVPAVDADGAVITGKKVKSYAIASEDATNNVYTLTGWVTEEYDLTTGEVAEDVEVPATATKMDSPDTGKFTIHGLDADTYFLNEYEAPDGYNKLANDATFTITTASLTGAATFEVLNQSGAELPSTGGMGTTIFYAVGGAMMAGAAILLVTKKKMANEE